MENGSACAQSLDLFLESSPALLFVAKPTGAVVRGSDSLRRMLDPAFKDRGLLGKTVHPKDRAAVASAWARLKRGAAQVHFRCRIRGAEGTYRTLTCRARRSTQDELIHGSLWEPTAEDASAANAEQLLRAVIDNIPICLWAVDRRGVFTFHDGKGLEGAGLERGDHVGKSVFELYGDQPEGLDGVRQALAGEPSHAPGQSYGIDWDTWFIPVRNASGEVESVIGFTLDVTEARRAQRELQAKLDLIEKQRQVIRDLSAPVIEVWEGVLAVPMVGIVDSMRTAEIMDDLLHAVMRTQAHHVILDLTGVEVVDTKVANHLISLVRSIRLLGAEGVITGIKPSVAQTMITLGLDLSDIRTFNKLRAGLRFCIARRSERAPQAAG